jgi:hypothetical protein
LAGCDSDDNGKPHMGRPSGKAAVMTAKTQAKDKGIPWSMICRRCNAIAVSEGRTGDVAGDVSLPSAISKI